MSAPMMMRKVWRTPQNKYRVESIACNWIDRPYLTRFRSVRGKWIGLCDCRGFMRWRTPCKHLIALEDWIKRTEETQKQQEQKNEK